MNYQIWQIKNVPSKLHLRDFEDKILIHQFLKSESTKGLCMYPCMVNSDKQERSRIVQLLI